MFVNIFLHILKRILPEKYPNIEFYFYLLTPWKTVHMARKCNILSLSEHIGIISDTESISKFKVVMPQLIHTTK